MKKTLEKIGFMTTLIFFALLYNVFVGIPLATWYSLKLVFGPKGQLKNNLFDIQLSFIVIGPDEIKDARWLFEKGFNDDIGRKDFTGRTKENSFIE